MVFDSVSFPLLLGANDLDKISSGNIGLDSEFVPENCIKHLVAFTLIFHANIPWSNRGC